MKAYQLLITLLDVEPVVWRRLIIPADTHFKRLHDTIQFAMGWQDYHLFEFEVDYGYKGRRLQIVGNDETYEEHIFQQRECLLNPPKDDADEYRTEHCRRVMETEMRKARTTKLPKYIEKHSEILYVYDYGDDWRHLVSLEKIIEDYPYGYPVLLEGEGACPPEDVGGPRGYTEFLQAWNDPSHAEHEETRTWGESQLYGELDIVVTNELMKECLKLKKVKK